MRRVNMVVTEYMKTRLCEIANNKEMKCSALIRMILEMMFFRIRGAKTKKYRKNKKYRFISENRNEIRVVLSFYLDEMVYASVMNVESDIDFWSKSAFLRRIFDIYIHYMDMNAEGLFLKFVEQSAKDYEYKLKILKEYQKSIIISKSYLQMSDKLVIEYGNQLEPLSVMMV